MTINVKNILILGGTGTLSYTVLLEALKRNYNVSTLNRGNKSNMIPIGVDNIICDFYDEVELRKQLLGKKYDVVIDFLSRKPKDLERVFPIVSKSCKQYIFISSACVYRRNDEDMPIKEESPKPNTNWSYNIEKYECEKKLITLSKCTNTSYTIVRPYITYDNERIPFGIAPNYKYHRTIIERIKNGKPMFIWGDGTTMTTSTYVSEFAVGLVGLILNPKAMNEDFHITSSFSYPIVDVLLLLYQKLGISPNIIHIPTDYLCQYLPQYKDMLLGDRILPALFDNKKIKDAVPEFSTKIKLSEGLDRVIEYYHSLKRYDYDYQYDAQIDRMLNKYGIKCHYVKYKNTSRKGRIVYCLYRYLSYGRANQLYSKLSKIFNYL